MSDDDAGVQLLTELGIALGDPSETELSSTNGETLPISEEELQTPVAEVDSPPAFRVQRLIFLSMVEQVMGVVPLRDFYPQLKNILVVASGDRLTLTGSDSTSSVISATSTVRVERAGRVLIGAARFASVIRRAAGAEVVIRCEGSSVHIESGAASWSLRVASVQDYPPLPDTGDLTWHEIDRQAFLRSMVGTRYAVSKDDNKDHILQLDIAGGVVTATDDQRFAQVRENLPPDFAVQLPASGADLLVKMLERNDATQFRVADTPFHVVAEIGPMHAPDRAIIAHLMRPFPPEARTALVAPVAENRDVLTVSANALLEVLRRAAPTADEETGAVALRVGSPEPGRVTVATRNRYGDLSTEVIEASFLVAGSDEVAKARTVVVAHTHLADALKAVVGASPIGDDAEGAGMARVLLGQPRSRSRPAYVLISDAGGTVQAVLSQVRSDWIQ
jgi:DNA polymerase III sliding clamp (beta) subunit (PCNA family)